MDHRGVGLCRGAVALLLAVVAALPASVSEAQTRRQAPFTITAPDRGPSGESFGPIVLAIVDYRRAYSTGGYWCPPLGPDEREEDYICYDSNLVEGPATIVGYLSPRTEGWRDPGPRPRIRFLGGHAVRRVDAARRLAILESTSGGFLWGVWSTPVERGWACFPPDIIARFALTSRVPLRPHGDNAHCLRLSSLN